MPYAARVTDPVSKRSVSKVQLEMLEKARSKPLGQICLTSQPEYRIATLLVRQGLLRRVDSRHIGTPGAFIVALSELARIGPRPKAAVSIVLTTAAESA